MFSQTYISFKEAKSADPERPQLLLCVLCPGCGDTGTTTVCVDLPLLPHNTRITNPTREGKACPQAPPDQDRGLFAGTLESLLSRDLEYQTIWLHRLSTARERQRQQEAWGPQQELTINWLNRYSHINQSKKHNTTYVEFTFGRSLATRDGIVRSQLENNSRRNKTVAIHELLSKYPLVRIYMHHSLT